MALNLLVVILGIVGSIHAQTNTTIKQATRDGTTYYLQPGTGVDTFEKARSACETIDAELVQITDADYAFIVDTFSTHPGKAWVGIKNSKWLDCRMVSEGGSVQFGSGEGTRCGFMCFECTPANGVNGISPPTGLHDFGCGPGTEAAHVLCSSGGITKPDNDQTCVVGSNSDTAGAGGGGAAAATTVDKEDTKDGKKYMRLKGKMDTFVVAKASCEAKGAELLQMTSKDYEWVRDNMKIDGAQMWLGIKDGKWMDGRSVTEGDTPNQFPAEGNDKCGYMCWDCPWSVGIHDRPCDPSGGHKGEYALCSTGGTTDGATALLPTFVGTLVAVAFVMSFGF
eukprot:TRINITY_DN67152_c4_g1_i1.p1 TRINITY_DN67152_c4_g1~~TRINITY_DN67152_c4_g1_i1.p1  ORF type:complete len:338 (+),score=20.98 TRINITY_DN67152_c4_g1_i1:49-1062(+)